MGFLAGQEKTWDFDFPSLGVAALGAIVLLALVQPIQAISTKPPRDRT